MSTSADRIVEAAAYLLEQGDRAGAEGLLSQALRLDPRHVRAQETMQRLRAMATGVTATPAPQLAPRTGATGLRPATWSSRPQVDGPTAAEAGPPKPPTSGGLDLEAVRSAASRWREGLVTPAPMTDLPPPASSAPGGRRATEPPFTPALPPFSSSPSSGLRRASEQAFSPALPPFSSSPSSGLRGASEPPFSSSPSSGLRRASDPSFGSSPSSGLRTDEALVGAPECTLLVVTGPRRGEQLTVGPRAVTVGRGEAALDLADDPFASSRHATFAFRDGELLVTDGGSASGTWHTISGSGRVAAGESFSVGQQRLRYLGPVTAPAMAGVPPLGGPVPAASWRLEHTLVGNRPGRVWVLRGIVTVGREDAGLTFDDDHALAAQHADLRPSGDGLELVDRSDGLGTWLCLPPGAERRVAPGALVRVGSSVLQLAAR